MLSLPDLLGQSCLTVGTCRETARSQNAITTGSNGNIYVNGRGQDATGVNHWIVRKLAPAL